MSTSGYDTGITGTGKGKTTASLGRVFAKNGITYKIRLVN